MSSIKSKAQSWSIDIALGVIVFMAAFFILYALLNSNPAAKAGILKEEATAIIKQVASEDDLLRTVDSNEINLSRIAELKNMSYEELKRRLRIESDFCIYIEDEKGNLILINNTYKGIGSPNINLSGAPCSQR